MTFSGKLGELGVQVGQVGQRAAGHDRSIGQPGLVYSSPECLGTGLFTGASLVLVTPVTSSLSQHQEDHRLAPASET